MDKDTMSKPSEDQIWKLLVNTTSLLPPQPGSLSQAQLPPPTSHSGSQEHSVVWLFLPGGKSVASVCGNVCLRLLWLGRTLTIQHWSERTCTARKPSDTGTLTQGCNMYSIFHLHGYSGFHFIAAMKRYEKLAQTT